MQTTIKEDPKDGKGGCERNTPEQTIKMSTKIERTRKCFETFPLATIVNPDKVKEA